MQPKLPQTEHAVVVPAEEGRTTEDLMKRVVRPKYPGAQFRVLELDGHGILDTLNAAHKIYVSKKLHGLWNQQKLPSAAGFFGSGEELLALIHREVQAASVGV